MVFCIFLLANVALAQFAKRQVGPLLTDAGLLISIPAGGAGVGGGGGGGAEASGGFPTGPPGPRPAQGVEIGCR